MKQGGGTLRLHDGRIVKKGERFYANPENIPSAFRDSIILLDAEPTQQKTFKKHGVVEDKTPKYKLEPVVPTESAESDTEELFNIVDLKGKVVNEEPHLKEVAEKLLKELNA